MRERRWMVPLLGLAVLACLAGLYAFDRPLYAAALKALMMRPSAVPFIDIAQMPGVVACWQRGVDPYLTASCDFLNRPFAYSPLWLRAGILPTEPGAAPWLGTALAVGFFLSLALLPPPRGRAGVASLALAALSGLPAFALERANIDVAMFLLIIAGAALCFRPGAGRFLGYPLWLLAGLLKFYPLVLGLLVLRERLGRAILLGAAMVAALALFTLHFRRELAEMAQNLPSLGYFKDTFGARQLAVGLGAKLQSLGVVRLPLFGGGQPADSFVLVLDAVLISHLAALATALWLALDRGMRSALAALTEAERGFLAIGAALLVGCFFAGQNVSYRGIHFLFVVPGVTALALRHEAGGMRTLFRVTGGMMLFLLWGLSLQQLVAWLSGGTYRPMGGSVAMDLYWIVHELAWWWVVTVLLAVLVCFVVDSAAWRDLSRRDLSRRDLSRRKPRRA